MKLKVFGYLRVSSKGQAKDDRDGLPRQRAAIKAWCAANNARVAQWFEEPITGKTAVVDRPAYAAMMVALLSNGVRTVVIEKLDRLARDIMVQESAIAELKNNGFTLISTVEPDLCSDDPSRVAMRQMMGVFNAYERATIVFKLRAARLRKQAKTHGKEGKEGRKAYGYRPGEREVIERMFQIYDEGAGYTAVHRYLNAEGVKTRSGGEWTAATVMRIMKREPHRLHRMTLTEAAMDALKAEKEFVKKSPKQ